MDEKLFDEATVMRCMERAAFMSGGRLSPRAAAVEFARIISTASPASVPGSVSEAAREVFEYKVRLLTNHSGTLHDEDRAYLLHELDALARPAPTEAVEPRCAVCQGTGTQRDEEGCPEACGACAGSGLDEYASRTAASAEGLAPPRTEVEAAVERLREARAVVAAIESARRMCTEAGFCKRFDAEWPRLRALIFGSGVER